MENAANAVYAQIARDHLSGFLSYTIPQGTTMSHTTVSSWPSSIPEPPSSLMESPTILQYSPDSSVTGSSPDTRVDGYVDEDRLPLLPKDPKLQVYFIRMEKALRTCHPAAIHAEVVNLARDIVGERTDVTSSIGTVAETLVKAGCRKVEYSRSCALIAHEIFSQLESTSHDASISFKDSLIGAVMKVFDGHYFKVNLWHRGGLDGLSSVEEEMINVAGFAGDLFALGLLPARTVDERIIASLVYANQVSTVHCRGLHLFLLHAKAHIGPSIGLDVLGKVRRQLLRCIRGPPMSYDRMAQLWVIECCTIIDRTVEQDRVAHQGGGKLVAVPHEWDMLLSKNGWFSALIS